MSSTDKGKMNAVVFDNELKFIRDHPVPAPAAGEALIRVHLAGICNTDLEIIRGYAGFRGIIGHEFVGTVEDVKDAESELKGKRVVGSINCGCGSCQLCLRGLENHCMSRKVLGIIGRDGAMAGYTTLPTRNLLAVPDEVPDEEAVFTEPLAAAFRIIDQLLIRSDDKVIVIGDGKLGLLAALTINLFHHGLTLAGRHENKMAVASRQGIRAIGIEVLEESMTYDIVIEATGSPTGFESAMRLVKPGGTIVLKSTVAARYETNLSPLVVNEVTVIGSRCGPFGPALKALSGRRIDVRPLICAVFPFSMAAEAFQSARSRDSLKVLIDFRD